MLQNSYELLIHYLEGMIADGVCLAHGGNIFNWDDTEIPELLEKIKQEKKQEKNGGIKIESGELLKNKFSGQKAAVVNDNGDVVSMILTENILTYPKKIIWEHFERTKAGE